MKSVVLLCVGLAGSLPLSAAPATEPLGTVLELHSCEVYAGGCIVSSEAVQGGHYMLRVWNFSAGEFGGCSLAGLQMAVLQVSEENLATADSAPERAVAYLPAAATQEQRSALKSWARSSGVLSGKERLDQRVLPLHLTKSGDGFEFSAGSYIHVKTASLASCPTGSCGEALWYRPRSAGNVFTVAVNRSSAVSEPLLELSWQDGGKKSVFLSRFGDRGPATNLYVSSVDLCGSGGTLF